MIAGTLAFEDLTLHFMHQSTGEVSLTVCDALTGKQGSVLCNATLFAKALGLALDPDGDTAEISAEDYDALVDAVVPAMPELEEGDTNPLRWLP
jgi:hypothetical protein